MKTKLIILQFLVFSLVSPKYILATSLPICNPILNDACYSAIAPEDYTNNVLSAVFSLFFIVGILYFMWNMLFNAYHLISAEGDPKAYQTAKDGMTHGAMGIAVVFSVFALVKLVGWIFGITDLEGLTITWPHL